MQFLPLAFSRITALAILGFGGLNVVNATSTMLVKNLACFSAGQPNINGGMTIEQINANQYKIAKLSLNSLGGTVLQANQASPIVSNIYTKYVVQKKPFTKALLNSLLTSWQMFGMKFDWQKHTYHCQVN